MNWKDEAIEMLTNYNAKRQSLIIIPLQIAETEAEMTSLRSCANMIGVKGSKGTGSDDRVLNCIVKKEALQRCLEQSKLYVAAVEKGLEVLTDEERHILTVMYINREKGWKDRLMDELLLVEESSLYKKSRKILRQFTIAMYGCLEC